MTVLVTGASGFLGSHLVKKLVQKNFVVIALKRSQSDLYRFDGYSGDFFLYNADEVPLEEIFSQHAIDVVINTVTDYGRRGSSVFSMLETNLMFGLKILETATLHGINAFINTDTLLAKTINPYALSKAQLVEWMRYYAEHSSTKMINVKIEHMYGPKDDDKKFISWLISQLINRVETVDLTSGIQKRDFVYIDDVIRAYEAIIDHLDQCDSFEEFELGSGTSIEMKQFISMIFSIISEQQPLSTRLNFGAVPYRKGEAMVMEADIKKLQTFGWDPQTSLQEGLKKTLAEYI